MNTANWQTLPLGDALTFQRGFDITRDTQVDGPYAVISSSGPHSSHVEFKVHGPGVIIGRKGSLGTVFFSNNDFWPHDTTLWVKDFHGNCPKFAYYFLKTMGFERLDAGASNPTLNRNHIHTIPVRWPALTIQHQIADVLSAYDELIENSQRRIRILETMARSLYREWFVEFRFPGHEKVRRMPSALGEIPEKWIVSAIGESVEISGGGTPSRQNPLYWNEGTIPWFSPSHLTAVDTMFMDDSPERITALGLAESSARLFPPFSVMLTSRATIGAMAINTEEACTNQGFITCVPNERIPLYYLYHWVRDNVPQFLRLASGSTFKEISRGVFKTVHFLVPEAGVLHKFEAHAKPLALQALTLQRQIRNLKETRDLLLPRLLSGQFSLNTA